MAVPLSARSSFQFAGLKDAVGGPVNFQAMTMQLPSYVVANALQLDATPAGMLIYVSDEVGGAVPAFSDGMVWRRVTDRAVIA